MSAHFNRLFETSLSPGASASKQTMQHLVMATVECSLDNNNKKITVKFTVSRARLGVFLSVHLYSLAEIQNASQKKEKKNEVQTKLASGLRRSMCGSILSHTTHYNLEMLVFSIGTYCLQLCLLNRVSTSFSNGGKAQNLDKSFFFFTWEILQ